MSPETPRPPDFTLLKIFSALIPAERALVERKGRYELRQPRDVFCRQGEFTGRFFVVVSGLVSAYRLERNGSQLVLESLGPEKWFGEISALSNQPAIAKYSADHACVTFSIPPDVFKVLYSRKNSNFRRLIDENYRAQGLLIHLRLTPLFRGLSEEELKALRHEVRFESFEANKTIAKQGEQAQAVYLVRNGAIKCVRPREGGERILAFFSSNSSFGERCLATSDRAWRGDYVAMTAADVLVVPREVMLRLSGAAQETLHATASLLVAEEEGADTAPFQTGAATPSQPSALQSSAARELLVAKESIKGGEALVINLERCVRCNMCVESCVAVHEDHVPRLSKKGTRMPYLGQQGEERQGVRLVTSCYHCQIPSCMLVCALGAIRRDVRGLIRIDYESCLGCASCADACPYDVIRMTRPDAPAAAGGLWESLFGRFFPKSEEPEAPAVEDPDAICRGKSAKEGATPQAVKCDLCAGLPFQACVYNCPTSAIGRRNPSDLLVDLEQNQLRAPGTFSYTRQ
jgi:Fe-S-cluster-containing hydrogenase component 2